MHRLVRGSYMADRVRRPRDVTRHPASERCGRWTPERGVRMERGGNPRSPPVTQVRGRSVPWTGSRLLRWIVRVPRLARLALLVTAPGGSASAVPASPKVSPPTKRIAGLLLRTSLLERFGSCWGRGVPGSTVCPPKRGTHRERCDLGPRRFRSSPRTRSPASPRQARRRRCAIGPPASRGCDGRASRRSGG